MVVKPFFLVGRYTCASRVRTMRETSLCASASTLQALCGTHRNTHSMHNEEASTHYSLGAAG